jgi:hypothetical protein
MPARLLPFATLEAVFALHLGIGLMMFVGATVWVVATRQRKPATDIRREHWRRQHEFNDLLIALEQRRLDAAVEQQREDSSAVSVPVTDCDRQMRRRVLPLE